jgi:hypothetical protein
MQRQEAASEIFADHLRNLLAPAIAKNSAAAADARNGTPATPLQTLYSVISATSRKRFFGGK